MGYEKVLSELLPQVVRKIVYFWYTYILEGCSRAFLETCAKADHK